jgi:hypothetical protein
VMKRVWEVASTSVVASEPDSVPSESVSDDTIWDETPACTRKRRRRSICEEDSSEEFSNNAVGILEEVDCGAVLRAWIGRFRESLRRLQNLCVVEEAVVEHTVRLYLRYQDDRCGKVGPFCPRTCNLSFRVVAKRRDAKGLYKRMWEHPG